MTQSDAPMQSGATNPAMHPRRAKALEHMMEGRTDAEIAREIGCDVSTVWRWRTDPAFAATLKDAQRERIRLLDDRMMALVPRAIETIAGLMDDTAQPGLLRLRCAEALLERASWATGTKERRIQEQLAAEMESMATTLRERLPAGVMAQVIAALSTPWEEPTEPTAKRPRIAVVYPGAGDDDETTTRENDQ